MGKKVNDDQFLKMMKEVSSGYWDILNFSFNRGSEYIVTFYEKANEDHQERVRISARLADAITRPLVEFWKGVKKTSDNYI